MIILMAYIILSVIIGIIDTVKIYNQNCYLDSFPIGDIGEYVEARPIIGIHNFIFLPSWIVIGITVLISGIFNW